MQPATTVNPHNKTNLNSFALILALRRSLLAYRQDVARGLSQWDAIIESRESLSLDDYLRRAHSLCLHIRVWDETVRLEDRRRALAACLEKLPPKHRDLLDRRLLLLIIERAMEIEPANRSA